MKLTAQANPIEIEAEVEGNVTQEIQRHGPLLPNTLRCIICGPSECGKTNLILSLLISPNGLYFDNVYIFSKSLYQPKYKFLKEVCEGIVGFYAFKNNDEVLAPTEAKENSIFIFDDVSCERQNIVKEYFAFGRHSNVDSFYLCQSYSLIPKQLIRDNANFIVIFKQDYANLLHIWKNHVNTDMTFDTFSNFCKICWDRPFGFTVIDKTRSLKNGRYRYGINHFLSRI